MFGGMSFGPGLSSSRVQNYQQWKLCLDKKIPLTGLLTSKSIPLNAPGSTGEDLSVRLKTTGPRVDAFVLSVEKLRVPSAPGGCDNADGDLENKP